MRRSRKLSPDPGHRRPLASCALVAGTALLGMACVTSGAHDEVVRERDGLLVSQRQLEEKVRLLGIANQSLDDHVAKLVSEREELLEGRDHLSSRLATTEERKAELASNLRSREEELAVTAAALVAQSQKVDQLQGTYEGLVSDLESEVAQGQIRISQLQEGLQVDVSQDILFPSGSAALSADGKQVLSRVAARLKGMDYEVNVEGHSDNMPIRGVLAKRYPSNWELAGARAASVVRLFAQGGVAGDRMLAVSRGDTAPIADNGTPEGRSRNRRIEIRLRPRSEIPEASPGS